MPKITITSITPKGDKVLLIDYTVDGKKGPTARAWKSQGEKWAVGEVIEAEFEKKPGYNDGPEEVWFKSAPRGKFGGGGKPQRTPEETWSIVAQTCIKAAADLQIALIAADPAQAKGFDINKVTSWADDMFDQARDKVKKAVGA